MIADLTLFNQLQAKANERMGGMALFNPQYALAVNEDDNLIINDEDERDGDSHIRGEDTTVV